MNLLKYPVLRLLSFLLLIGSLQYAKAQTPSSGINNVIAKIDTFNKRLPAEKLYLQFDKPYYAVGDTIWFKAYLLNSDLNYSALSSRLYVDVVTDSGSVVKHLAFPVAYGVTWGHIPLGSVREGTVSVRAYTNWMRNFGQDYFFNRTFYISNPQKQTWLINAASQLTGANNIKMAVKFTSLNTQPAGLRPLQLRVMDGKKTLFKGAGQTTADGMLDVNFPLPDKTSVKNLVLVAQDKSNTKQQVNIPVNTHRAKDVDVQFMPEGGYMVAGLPSHVGFKAIGDDGHGVNISGKIVNAKGDELATFESAFKGLGTFELAPQAGEFYTAKIQLPGGQTKDVPLPAIKASGTQLRVRNVMTRDSMDVSVFLSPDLVKPGSSYYLTGQSRGAVCFGAAVSTAKAFATVHIAKALFPTGIVHLTLLNTQNQPVNERLTFIDHHDNLKAEVITSQKGYAPHDSIPVKIKVSDMFGKAVQGSFSVAVTDDAQVKADSTDNILTRFLLSTDLKGFVETPEAYFTGNKTAWQALDALLLTQGWVGYDWSAIDTTPKATFQPEYEYTVNGYVGNLFNKPIAKAQVVLLSKGKYSFIKDTVTDAKGRFVFRNFPPIDSVTFVLEAQNARHKVINSGITIDENQAPDIIRGNTAPVMPWYVNSDPALLNYVKTNPTYHSDLDKAQFGPQGRMLNQVNIRNTAIVKGSSNLNGAGVADQVIDQETIENANKTSLADLLEQKITGYHEGYLPKGHDLYFFIRDKKARFVFDGVDINRFYIAPEAPMPNDYYNYVKGYLDYFTAEDIKGIEVLTSAKNVGAYNNRNLTGDEMLAENPAGARGAATAYIEITTRSGNGPFTRTATGIYVYKPLKNAPQKIFYKPRYTVKNPTSKYGDLRSTIDWEPGIVTDKNGEATISFYAADQPTTYTITLEGADLTGKIGYQTQKVTIRNGK